MCNAMGYIEGDIFVEVKQHTQHHSMAGEIQRLQLLERCPRVQRNLCGRFLIQRHSRLEMQLVRVLHLLT